MEVEVIAKGILGMGAGRKGPQPPAVAVGEELLGEGRRFSFEELEAAVKWALEEKAKEGRA